MVDVASADLEQGLHLDGTVGGQHGHADRGSRMAAVIAEHRHHEVGRAVHDRRYGGEIGLCIDETTQTHAAHDAVEVAERRLGLGQHIDGAQARGFCPSLGRNGAAELALMPVGEFAVWPERHLAGDDELRSDDNVGHVVGDRRGGRRKRDAEIGELLFHLAHEKTFSFVIVADSPRTGSTSYAMVEHMRPYLLVRSSASDMQGFASRRLSVRLAPLALLIGCAGIWGSAEAAPEVVLAPHHATYKLSLSRSSGDKAPAAASGMISYDFSGSACEGYATVFRQMTEMQPPEGESRVSDMRSATFEDGDARQFRFSTRTTYSSAPEDDLDGAVSKRDDGSMAVAIDKPSQSKADLKPALFPTEHLRKVVDAARAGRKLLSEAVYDGSDTGKIIYDTLAVIGAQSSDSTGGEAPAASLRGLAHWPVTLSYFEQGKSDTQPNYTLSFMLFENGVSTHLKLDYGTFVLTGDMVDLKLMPTSTCKK